MVQRHWSKSGPSGTVLSNSARIALNPQSRVLCLPLFTFLIYYEFNILLWLLSYMLHILTELPLNLLQVKEHFLKEWGSMQTIVKSIHAFFQTHKLQYYWKSLASFFIDVVRKDLPVLMFGKFLFPISKHLTSMNIISANLWIYSTLCNIQT